VEAATLEKAIGTTKDTKKECLAEVSWFTQLKKEIYRPSASAFVFFVSFVV